jgi:uncharacterized damage-inducible protein DinB
MSVASLYEGWPRIQTRLLDRLARLGPDELQLRASSDGWPIWATVSHLAVVRVYWLCGVFREPGAETTPFADPFADGWEDRPDIPRAAAELAFAVDTSWRIVESCLDQWTVETLGRTFSRVRDGAVEQHSRQSVLTRLLMHDAFHAGEISLVLGMHGLPSMDPWAPPPRASAVDAPLRR